jgi:hypothetical protein
VEGTYERLNLSKRRGRLGVVVVVVVVIGAGFGREGQVDEGGRRGGHQRNVRGGAKAHSTKGAHDV